MHSEFMISVVFFCKSPNSLIEAYQQKFQIIDLYVGFQWRAVNILSFSCLFHKGNVLNGDFCLLTTSFFTLLLYAGFSAYSIYFSFFEISAVVLYNLRLPEHK